MAEAVFLIYFGFGYAMEEATHVSLRLKEFLHISLSLFLFLSLSLSLSLSECKVGAVGRERGRSIRAMTEESTRVVAPFSVSVARVASHYGESRSIATPNARRIPVFVVTGSSLV